MRDKKREREERVHDMCPGPGTGLVMDIERDGTHSKRFRYT